MVVSRWIIAFTLLASTVPGAAFLGNVGRSRGSHMDTKLAMASGEDQDVGRRSFLVATAGAVCFGAPRASVAETLHKVDYPVKGKCGQADVPQEGVFFVKQFGGFKDGSCATEGYGAAEGTAKGTGEKDKEREYKIFGK